MDLHLWVRDLGKKQGHKFDRRWWMITVVPRWLPQKLNYFYKCWNFQKKKFFERRLRKKMKNILKYFGFLWNGTFKINYSFGQTCVKVIFVFLEPKKEVKVYQPKVKKGKNVSMGFLSNFRSDIIRLLDQCCTRPVVFLFGRNLAKISTWKIWLQLI